LTRQAAETLSIRGRVEGLLAHLGISAAMSKSMGFAALIMASTTALRVPPPVMQMYDAQRPAVSAPPGTAHVSGSVVPTKTQQSILVQGGGTLRTWSYRSPAVERVQVMYASSEPNSAPCFRQLTVVRDR
jgi:hypothetical protein